MDPEAGRGRDQEEEPVQDCSCFIRAFYCLKLIILFNAITFIVTSFLYYFGGFFQLIRGKEEPERG